MRHPALAVTVVASVLALVLWGAGLPPFTGSSDTDGAPAERLTATDHVIRGNDHLASGQYESALAEYYRAILLDPGLASAFFNRGNAYLRKGKYELAIKDYDTAAKLDPQYTDAAKPPAISSP